MIPVITTLDALTESWTDQVAKVLVERENQWVMQPSNISRSMNDGSSVYHRVASKLADHGYEVHEREAFDPHVTWLLACRPGSSPWSHPPIVTVPRSDQSDQERAP